MRQYIKSVLANMPADWLALTTHRLDIYDESRAKSQFIEQFEHLYQKNDSSAAALSQLPTAYDYIRLGHPLSSLLEWLIAQTNNTNADNVISFSSRTMPLLAILRSNLLAKKHSRIFYTGDLPELLDIEKLRSIYAYTFDLIQVEDSNDVKRDTTSSNVFITQHDTFDAKDIEIPKNAPIDFHISIHAHLGSILIANGEQNEAYIPDIQHVRRRETVAMTPADCITALKAFVESTPLQKTKEQQLAGDKQSVLDAIKKITATNSNPVVGSSGLSIQYAIMMGLIDHALEQYPEKDIKFIVPPNCYGGTNDQARRVAACSDKVEIMDLPVDSGSDMVQSVNKVLEQVAEMDAVPYIIAEIPTNPRVEVPDLAQLKAALNAERTTLKGTSAVEPVFILDQTFCPNVDFLGEDGYLSDVKTVSYASGSKFPSGGLCTAGYCVANNIAAHLMDKIALHLSICDNEATALQYEILAQQMPSMLQRIEAAYHNTDAFVRFIKKTLPSAKINFVSDELAKQGFRPSVFSLDLPTKGDTEAERETYKRALNHRLIKMMIGEIPEESKYCVSYGQLKGCYWTIPATSTQGTTKEGDKDYIVRVALSPNMDLEKHQAVFEAFVKEGL